MVVYSQLLASLLSTTAGHEMPEEAQAHIKRMTDYNVPGGKLNRGLTVVHSIQTLIGPSVTPLQLEQAAVLGWCIEWLQACFLVADDVMDASVTRRGQPCWYKLPGIDMISINDSFLLWSSLFVFLKQHFGTSDKYIALVDLFNEAILQTQLGQLLDLTSAPVGGPVDLDRFTIERYRLIVKYKTAFYSFYLPVAAAMVLAGQTDPKAFVEARSILCEMGEYFQVQDDYLDCYGAPEVIGKIGTDIQDNKCCWLVVQALSRASDEQKAVLKANYGKHDDAAVSSVKALYAALQLEDAFKQYEEASHTALAARIAAVACPATATALAGLLSKIYKRAL